MNAMTEKRDPRPYINPNNGERTSFPHAVSEYRPRDPEVAEREDVPV